MLIVNHELISALFAVMFSKLFLRLVVPDQHGSFRHCERVVGAF